MTEALVVCVGCYRHVRSSERACPFCAATLGAPPPASRPGALHTAVIAAALALGLSDRAHAQQHPSVPGNPRIGMEHGPAQGYGAPPMMRDPTLLGPGQPQPVVPSPVEQSPVERLRVVPLFELSRQPLPGPGRTPPPGTAWSSELVIHADGSWFASGRSGRLTPPQMTLLRRTIAQTRMRLARRRAVTCVTSPDSMQRVRAGRYDLRWAPGCEPNPDPSVARLIAIARRLTATRG